MRFTLRYLQATSPTMPDTTVWVKAKVESRTRKWVRRILYGWAGATVACAAFSFTLLNSETGKRQFDDASVPPLTFKKQPTRRECIARLQDASTPEKALDVLVIGGGCTGCGVALDAATRGLRVGLVELDDYASGTSSRSTKLIHGGVRYLEKAVYNFDVEQYNLVAEALGERSIMIHQAPHLCSPLPTLIPCYGSIDVPTFWTGMKLYDLIALFEKGSLKPSFYKLPVACLNDFPLLRHEDKDRSLLFGGVVYYDGQMDDARMCLSEALTAASYGAAVANHAEVKKVDLVPTSNIGGDGTLAKVKIFDHIAKKEFSVYAKAVVNAAGPFSDEVRKLADDTRGSCMVPSSGTHVTLPARYCQRDSAMIVPSPDGRVTFSIPWLGSCIAGTTDTPTTVSRTPRGTRDDVKFILSSLEGYVGPIPVTDVKSVWCGIRPLARRLTTNNSDKDAPNSSKDIVREHIVDVDLPHRMISITGGKWTTYRKMSQDVVDAILKGGFLNSNAIEGAGPCVTANVRMVGAHELEAARAKELEWGASVPEVVRARWLSAFGDRSPLVALEAQTMKNNKSSKTDVVQPLATSQAITDAEVRYCALYEHCESVSDYLERRSRLAFLDVVEAAAVIPHIADVMGQTLGWSKARRQEAVNEATRSLQQFTAA